MRGKRKWERLRKKREDDVIGVGLRKLKSSQKNACSFPFQFKTVIASYFPFLPCLLRISKSYVLLLFFKAYLHSVFIS